LACGVLALASPAHAAEPTLYQRALAAGYKAAFLCSGIFNAGRTQAQVEALELTGIYPEYQGLVASLPAKVENNWVFVPFDAKLPPRQAYFTPNRGCITLPIGGDEPIREFYPKLPPRSGLDGRKWPDGDRAVIKNNPEIALQAAGAFAGSYGGGSRTVGLIIVRDGQIVFERYAPDFTATTSNRTWSVAKSISGTLIGIAVRQGLIDPASLQTCLNGGTFSIRVKR
jgi:hypothetical protein